MLNVFRKCLVGFVFIVGAGACLPTQQNVKTVKDAVKLAQDACVVIRDVAPDNKEAAEVCAREEELRPYIKLILGGRAHQADGGVAK